MTLSQITHGEAQYVADFLQHCTSDQLSQDDLVAALVNALNRIHQLEEQLEAIKP